MEKNGQRQIEGSVNRVNLIQPPTLTRPQRANLDRFFGKESRNRPQEPKNKAVESGRNTPARMDSKQTADFLGFKEHDIPILALHGLLNPLGNPAPNAKKYFARAELVRLADNIEWMDAAQSALYEYWQTKNARRVDNNSDERAINE